MKEFILMLCQKTDLCQSTQLISEFIIVYWYLSAEQWWRGELIASKSASLDIARKRLMYTTNLYDKFITICVYALRRIFMHDLYSFLLIVKSRMPNIRKFRKFDLIPSPQCGAVSSEYSRRPVCIEKLEMVVLLESFSRLITLKY